MPRQATPPRIQVPRTGMRPSPHDPASGLSPCLSLAPRRCSCLPHQRMINAYPLHLNLPLVDLMVGDPGTRARLGTRGACPVRLPSMTGSIFSPHRRQRHPSSWPELHSSLNWVVIINPLQRGQCIGIGSIFPSGRFPRSLSASHLVD